MLIPLSPMDYYFLRKNLYTIQFVFPYEGRLDESRFRKAVALALRNFPALCSRLKIISDTEAALEVQPIKDVSIRVLSLADPFELSTEEDTAAHLVDSVITEPGEPLLKLTLGYSKTRSYLAVSLSHLVGDGHSLFQFLIAIAEILRDRVAIEPSNDRLALEAGMSNFARPVDLKRLFDETGYIRPRPPGPSSSAREKILYSFDAIEELKREAEAREFGLTTNDIIMADLLRKFYTKVPLYNGQLIVRCPIDYRRIHPEVQAGLLRKTYFGNSVCDAVALFDPICFQKQSLREVALQIRRAILRVDAPAILKNLECLRDLRLQEGIRVFESLGCPGLLVSNLTKMPFRQMDYGVGPPVRVIHASLNPRLAALFADPRGIEVSICLSN